MVDRRKYKLRHQKLAVTRSFAEIDATKERLPSSAVELTPAEKKLLKDPAWIDEEEADTILALRILKKEGDRGTPLEEFLKHNGVRVER
jgi:hypothetical protein